MRLIMVMKIISNIAITKAGIQFMDFNNLRAKHSR